MNVTEYLQNATNYIITNFRNHNKYMKKIKLIQASEIDNFKIQGNPTKFFYLF